MYDDTLLFLLLFRFDFLLFFLLDLFNEIVLLFFHGLIHNLRWYVIFAIVGNIIFGIQSIGVRLRVSQKVGGMDTFLETD